MPRRKTEEEVPEVETDVEELKRIRSVTEDRIQARISEYHKDFEEKSLTGIDKSQIRYMAQLEIAAGDAIDALTSTPNLTPSQRKALADAAKSMIAETRQLSDALGMSRRSRMTDEDSEMNDYLPKLHAEALNFLNDRGIYILCPHCLKEQPVVQIRQGFIVFNFEFESQWIWRSKCPRCGNKFEINSSNYQNFKVAKAAKAVADTKEDELEDDDEFSGEDPDQD